MSMLRFGGRRFWAITLVLVAVCVPVMAQSPNSVPGMLGQIITMLESVQQSLDGLTQTGESNVRVTPPVAFSAANFEAYRCGALNTATATRTVTIEGIDANQGVVDFVHTGTVSPLHTLEFLSTRSGEIACRFTVLDGTRADIRAGLTVFKTDVSVPPTIPAE